MTNEYGDQVVCDGVTHRIHAVVDENRIEDGMKKAISTFKRLEARTGPMKSRTALVAGFWAGLIATGCPDDMASSIADKYVHDADEGCDICSCKR